jgi:hypothetical protein
MKVEGKLIRREGSRASSQAVATPMEWTTGGPRHF